MSVSRESKRHAPMPLRRLKIRYPPDARPDIAGILRYSRQYRGKKQRDVYQDTLRKAVVTLAGEPEISLPGDESQSGLKATLERATSSTTFRSMTN